MFTIVQWLFRGRHAAWGTLVCGLIVTLAMVGELHREALILDRARLALRATQIQNQLDARLEKSEMLLHQLRDYLMLSGENREVIFARWCYENGLTINCPWILGIAVATNRNEFPLKAQLANPPASFTDDEWARLRQFAIDQLIECDLAMRSELENGLGFLPDYNLRTTNIATTRSLNDHWLGDTIKGSRLGMGVRQVVMLDGQHRPIIGTVFYAPIYRQGLDEYLTASVNRPVFQRSIRWLHLSALIVAPVDFRELLKTPGGIESDVGIEVFSSTNQTSETWLNSDQSTPRANDPGFKAYLTHRATWPMYGQRFSLFFYTTPLFDSQSPRRLARTTGAAGLVITILASMFVGLALRARDRQERMTEQIREARDALASAQQERNKISRDLHDGTIQSLYVIQLGLGHALQRLETEPATVGRELTAVRREVDTVIGEIRDFIASLSTHEESTGKAVDFLAVTHALAQRARTATQAQIDVQCDPEASGRLTGDQAVHLANIVREALSNSVRHAKPRRVNIGLQAETHRVVLKISDDGTGFDTSRPPRQGVGLASMAVRAREMRGAYDIQSSPEQGTRVRVSVPTAPTNGSGEDPPQ